MDWDEYLVTFAMDSDRVIIVFELIHGRGELHVDFFSDSCGNHALFVVPNLEVVGLWGQYV